MTNSWPAARCPAKKAWSINASRLSGRASRLDARRLKDARAGCIRTGTDQPPTTRIDSPVTPCEAYTSSRRRRCAGRRGPWWVFRSLGEEGDDREHFDKLTTVASLASLTVYPFFSHGQNLEAGRLDDGVDSGGR